MGRYSTLFVDECLILECDEVNPAVMMLFTPADKRVWKVPLADWMDWGNEEEDWSDDCLHVEYSCSVAELLDRLEIRGYTLSVAVKTFEATAPRRAAEFREDAEKTLSRDCVLPIDSNYKNYMETKRRSADILDKIKPLEWAKAVRDLKGLSNPMVATRLEEHPELGDAANYALIWSFSQFGFPGADELSMLRLLLEEWPDDDLVKYDLTHLVLGGGVFDSTTDMIQHTGYLMSRENDVFRKVLILTEGSSDCWVLERSIKLLMPHLSDFFSFMDFEGVRLEGGAGSLAKIVKAFSAADILNRVVAIFDNDTAGNSAADTLKAISIPSNIKVLTLPPIDIASEYPALGPNGLSVMDVNQLACSLELYFGVDCLTNPNGTLEPIQWKGYDAKLGRYQGELLAKADVIDRFRSKLTACERDPERLNDYDWTGIRLVVDMIRSAFHAEDELAHLEYEGYSEVHFDHGLNR